MFSRSFETAHPGERGAWNAACIYDQRAGGAHESRRTYSPMKSTVMLTKVCRRCSPDSFSFVRRARMFMRYPFSCHGGMYLGFEYVELDLRLVIMLPAYACSMLALLPRTGVCVHAGAGMPSSEAGFQTSEHLAIDWPGDPKSKTRSRATLCSTEQAPESLNLCCHSLPSAGPHRPFPGRV